MNKQLTENKLKRVVPEDIIMRKRELREEISLQKDVIVYSAKKMFNPFVANEGVHNGTRVVKKFNTGIVLVDGIMMGFKVVNNIRKLFRRR